MSSQLNQLQGGKSIRVWLQRGCGCVAVLFLGLVIFYGSSFLLRGELPSNPQLIAHRGGSVYQPENTMAAFRNAVNLGADWIEFDVQRTQDGVLIVIHDDTVDRTTDGSGQVADMTWEQIQTLDAGNGERVPTFEEVIALAKEEGVSLMPEAKSSSLYPGIEAQMVETIEKAGYADRTIIQSFDPEALEKAYAANPEMGLCALYGLWQFDLRGSQPGEAAYVCPMAEMVLLNPWMIQQAHREGKGVFVWFGIVENPLIMRSILALGADGLMVDDPVALADVIGR